MIQLAFESAEEVGVVGSPSTTSQVTLDVVGDAVRRPLVGSMVLLQQEMDGQTECALGTVTEITTRNQWHENTSMRGVVALHGRLLALSGRADVKGAEVNIQAVYADTGTGYRPSGSTLSMSPTTGGSVLRVTDTILQELTVKADENLFFMGDIYRMPGVRLPLNPGDFSGGRGAFHAGVFGPSGSGKSVFASYYIAGQLRHRDLGVLIIDPQSQFTKERGFTFSLQSLAKLQGRQVIKKDLATEIRLPQDKALFCELLAKTPFFRQGLVLRYQPALEGALAAAEEALERATSWANRTLDEVLDIILQGIRNATISGDIYKDAKLDSSNQLKPEGKAYKLQEYIDEALNGGPRRDRLMRYFRPTASLFSPTGPSGENRANVLALLHQAFEREPGRPRRVVILNMAFSMPADADQDMIEAIKKLNSEGTKARVLRTVFDHLERIAADDYQKGAKLLNTLVVFDEAWRYAPRAAADPEIKSLADQLAGYARETRKYGVGWMYVLQSPHTLHPDVWDQLKSGFRALGYGLTGADLELVRAQVDRPESISLYRSFTQPSDSNKQYPFMLVGAISPLSFTMAPLYTSIYTSYRQWVDANTDWLPARSVEAELDPVTGSFVYGQPVPNQRVEGAATAHGATREYDEFM
ncbi:hypothetical protein DQE82_19755 [Micromonospora sp. LHW51205]|uniref:ATP-binding protein n=1 Tax=Micromonospora sp. LHW51205 TaxID=2248752 RepID=UPI000DEA45E8|nr:DUF87 domain-containing protein [Micromonospora sp. LHW51205]RBQ07152.1 hypothetical protein DQE82_19755 [Micromonospora sp. LHW51205]